MYRKCFFNSLKVHSKNVQTFDRWFSIKIKLKYTQEVENGITVEETDLQSIVSRKGLWLDFCLKPPPQFSNNT